MWPVCHSLNTTNSAVFFSVLELFQKVLSAEDKETFPAVLRWLAHVSSNSDVNKIIGEIKLQE